MARIDPNSLIVVVNAVVVAVVLVVSGAWLTRGGLSVTEPGTRQRLGEFVLQFFVGKARGLASGGMRERVMGIAAPFLATLFLFIITSNLVGFLPVPVLNRPPTSHFGVTFALALCAVVGTLLVSAAVKGPGRTLKHLFWPNPLQWVSEITDVMSLSLRLFGNIAGEYMTVLLVLGVVPIGIPLILHALGLIPAFVQALVFTLLTASFLAAAVGEGGKRQEKQPRSEGSQERSVPEGRS